MLPAYTSPWSPLGASGGRGWAGPLPGGSWWSSQERAWRVSQPICCPEAQPGQRGQAHVHPARP